MLAKVRNPFFLFSKKCRQNTKSVNINNVIQINKEPQSPEQNLSKKNANKDQFIAGIVHELRNQISPIVYIGHFMKSEPRDKISDSEYNELVSNISSIASEMMEFTNDLIDVSQLESGNFSINMSEKIDIIGIIKRSIKLNCGLASKRKITIEFNDKIAVSKINLDERRMKQILVNLISNALKYGKEDSIITINAEMESDYNRKQLIISVKDQGIGMSENDIKMALSGEGTKIDKSSLGKDIDSHGIGLPLVKQLVGLQKGEMEIKSEINQGTEIKLKFLYLM